MPRERKSKRVHWEIMSRLEEAGEEDLCSLLNEVMGVQPYFGSGKDLAEYLSAIDALKLQGELTLRGYRIEEGLTVHTDAMLEQATECRSAFEFDQVRRCWKWVGSPRQMVEVPGA
jgi:hypothetical protein